MSHYSNSRNERKCKKTAVKEAFSEYVDTDLIYWSDIFDYSIIDHDDDMEGEFDEETCLREVERIEANERYDVVTMEEIIFALPEMDEEIWEEKTQNHY